MMMDIIVPLGLFFAFVLVVAQLARLASNISLNRTLREALRNDPASVPILADRLDSRQPWADGLIGWIFIAFAVGLVLMGALEPGEKRRVLQAALVPAIIGVTVLLYVRQAKKALASDVPSATPGATKPPARRRTKAG
jgi:quinol-cytochrome oxidoreductase complex cytochrome b subunit